GKGRSARKGYRGPSRHTPPRPETPRCASPPPRTNRGTPRGGWQTRYALKPRTRRWSGPLPCSSPCRLITGGWPGAKSAAFRTEMPRREPKSPWILNDLVHIVVEPPKVSGSQENDARGTIGEGFEGQAGSFGDLCPYRALEGGPGLGGRGSGP